MGSDFNPGGVKGIGPKKALSLIKQKKYPVQIFKEVEERIDFDWQKVFEIFKKPNVNKEKVVFSMLNEEKITEILVRRHEFNPERVKNQLAKLKEVKKENAQQKLF